MLLKTTSIALSRSFLERPVVIDDALVIRSMMKMTLSADHRLIDGATAARFVNKIKQNLEETSWWKGLVLL